MTRAKKVTFMKNQFIRARQPREEILEFRPCSGFMFTTHF